MIDIEELLAKRVELLEGLLREALYILDLVDADEGLRRDITEALESEHLGDGNKSHAHT